MDRTLPSLTALRAFEVSARHLSFTKAGEELGISQSAVSHQIKLLEAELGVRLFRRLTRRLELTHEGHELYGTVAPAFGRIGARVRDLRRGADRHSISLSLTFPIGAKWLAKKLREFVRERAGVDVRLHYSENLVDFQREQCDLAIRWGEGRWRGLEADPLLPAALIPACGAGFPRAKQPGLETLDFTQVPLLHEDSYADWSHWFEAAGLDPAGARSGTIIGDPLTLMEAAADGVILCRVALALEELTDGRLVPLSNLVINRHHAYWLVYPRGSLERPIVRELHDQLSQAAAKDRALLGQILPSTAIS